MMASKKVVALETKRDGRKASKDSGAAQPLRFREKIVVTSHKEVREQLEHGKQITIICK